MLLFTRRTSQKAKRKSQRQNLKSKSKCKTQIANGKREKPEEQVKSQIAKRKSKTPGSTLPGRFIRLLGFAICLLRFAF
jgi:hypothetical protein